MFWRFGGYASISAIDNLLEKNDVTLEELLDESDLIQELKQHNTKLIEYLREDKILERLLEYVVAPKPAPLVAEEVSTSEEGSESKGKEPAALTSRVAEEEFEEKEKKRNRYAYVAAEVLSSDNWSICESLMENQPLLRKFWEFLKLPPPLDALQASYFTKVNEAMLDKKTEEMLDLFKSMDGAVKDMLQHVDSPMVMDLLLKIISLEKQEGGAGIVDWLHSQDLMPILLSFLSSEHSWATQTSAGDFLKAIITISANASQNEQSCIGPNELTRQLVSKPCIEKLISDMLKGGNPLTVGVGIVIEVIRKNNSDYDPDVGAEANSVPSSRDPIYLGTLLRMFAQRVPDFMELILSPNHTIGGGGGPVTIKRKELSAAFGSKIEPLGFDRFKTCELMAELLHCSNMGLLNEVGSEDFVKARDAERERLKVDGKLGTSSSPSHLSEEDLTMKSSMYSRLESLDGGKKPERKLEVQNSTDDDGFEEVTHAVDLGDDTNDDFDEKPGEDDFPPVVSPLMSNAEEEFVDEPLSSPRLHTSEPVKMDEPEMTVLPLSPTKLVHDVESLKLKDQDEDTVMTSPPPSTSSDDSPGLPEVPDAPSTDGINAPPHAIEKEKPVENTTQSEASETESLDLLARPEDTPAPLFVKKVESPGEVPPPVPTAPEVPETPKMSEVPTVPAVPIVPEVDSEDTTMREVNDSVLVSGDGQDASAAPVVGDFLKMQFVEHKVVPTILDFFFRFPWNNFLHNVVYDVVQQVFNGPMDRGFNRSLAIDLFETGNITMRIVDGQKKSDEAQEKNKMRLGYMGHLTLIAEEVVKFTERHPPELLSDFVLEKVMNSEWITYVEVTLAETRERDNAILGGVRPDLSVGPRQAVMNAVNAANSNFSNSSALADAGLNGGTGLDSIDLANANGSSGFTLSGGTLLSGFGSSSDEEDDEMDEDNDEEGSRNGSAAEFSRYISTPSTTTATSSDLEPPSAPPPPPPPLNIAPSRARRQLAARLALHSKQNSEINTENGDKVEETEHRKNLNPFADADDDSDDEEGDGSFEIGDLEDDMDGRGLMGNGQDVGNGVGGKQHVGIPDLTSVLSFSIHSPGSPPPTASLGLGRAAFPSLWPFGGNSSSSSSPKPLGSYTGNNSIKSYFGSSYSAEQHKYDGDVGDDIDTSADDLDDIQSPDEIDDDDDEDSENSSDEGYEQEHHRGFNNDGDVRGAGAQYKGKRRLSVTTEAKRRTSLEEEDDEEVVHVAMAEMEADACEAEADALAKAEAVIEVEKPNGDVVVPASLPISIPVPVKGIENEKPVESKAGSESVGLGDGDGEGELVEIEVLHAEHGVPETK